MRTPDKIIETARNISDKYFIYSKKIEQLEKLKYPSYLIEFILEGQDKSILEKSIEKMTKEVDESYIDFDNSLPDNDLNKEDKILFGKKIDELRDETSRIEYIRNQILEPNIGLQFILKNQDKSILENSLKSIEERSKNNFLKLKREIENISYQINI